MWAGGLALVSVFAAGVAVWYAWDAHRYKGALGNMQSYYRDCLHNRAVFPGLLVDDAAYLFGDPQPFLDLCQAVRDKRVFARRFVANLVHFGAVDGDLSGFWSAYVQWKGDKKAEPVRNAAWIKLRPLIPLNERNRPLLADFFGAMQSTAANEVPDAVIHEMALRPERAFPKIDSSREQSAFFDWFLDKTLGVPGVDVAALTQNMLVDAAKLLMGLVHTDSTKTHIMAVVNWQDMATADLHTIRSRMHSITERLVQTMCTPALDDDALAFRDDVLPVCRYRECFMSFFRLLFNMKLEACTFERATLHAFFQNAAIVYERTLLQHLPVKNTRKWIREVRIEDPVSAWIEAILPAFNPNFSADELLVPETLRFDEEVFKCRSQRLPVVLRAGATRRPVEAMDEDEKQLHRFAMLHWAIHGDLYSRLLK